MTDASGDWVRVAQVVQVLSILGSLLALVVGYQQFMAPTLLFGTTLSLAALDHSLRD